MDSLSIVEKLKTIWWTGIKEVDGFRCTSHFLHHSEVTKPTLILSVGKAAEQMYLAAAEYFGADIPYVVATKYGHIQHLSGRTVVCSGHPVPDRNSIIAGKALMSRVKMCGSDEHLLFLVSGGASAIAELPEASVNLKRIIVENEQMLASGMAISAINSRRAKLSQLKAGKLLPHFKGKSILTLGLSDVEGNDISVIGSGIGSLSKPYSVNYQSEIVGSNKIARAAAGQAAIDAGFVVHENCENLYQDVFILAKEIAATLKLVPLGICIFGGEPTISLPQQHGKGGRNQSLALALAREISGLENITILVAGSDGTDGPTEAAGAIVDGNTWGSELGGEKALQDADAWTWFNQQGGLFVTGPTGTNVMDLVVAYKS